MSDVDTRIGALERRLAAAEDELAILRLVASYGPLVDTGDHDLAPCLFEEDGVYDVSYGRMHGRAAFTALLAGEDHQLAVAGGIAHVMGLPWIRIDGDRAVAINATQLYTTLDEGYAIFRVAQNVWHLRRTKAGWRIVERVNRLIGNDGAAVDLLHKAVSVRSRTANPGELA